MDRCSPSDDELLEAWATGDRLAGATLVDRHFDLVNRFFRSKVGKDVEDLVQQTFLGCIEARARYQYRSSFATFLLGIARNQLFSYFRGRRRDPAQLTLATVRDLGTSPTGKLAKRDGERLLIAALRQIPLDAQLILELAYWEELDGPALASVLEIPLNTAYSKLRRARESLRASLCALAPDSMEVECAWQTLSGPGSAQRNSAAD